MKNLNDTIINLKNEYPNCEIESYWCDDGSWEIFVWVDGDVVYNIEN